MIQFQFHPSRFRLCLSTWQVLSDLLNDRALCDDEDLYNGEAEDEDLELDLELDQSGMPKVRLFRFLRFVCF